ncbi:patatin-like phospholipase family protein [Nitrospirillum pindoramense]|uniref:NTE family protein n=1 Tax=Nitrospirillum amazonense TaxID=28077 RepID=A0A560H9X3_9PROT|nr:patatin-like phospholipase family protein [Nitrospirillum amazonense]TWB42424.1 NTE family protein [Nitrospirillum amazonense]
MPDRHADRHPPRPTLGLALGGGVARGWAHIGVLQALAQHGIQPDVVAGCSIGALVGGVYLGNHLETLEQWARNLTKMRILGLLDLRLRSGGGLIGGEKLLTELNQHLGDSTFDDLPSPFITVATDLATGKEVWLRRGSVVEAMRASYAMPGIFPPSHVDGRWLVDGALVDPVPVAACRAMGAAMVVAVDLNADIIGRTRSRHDAEAGAAAPPDAAPATEDMEAPAEEAPGIPQKHNFEFLSTFLQSRRTRPQPPKYEGPSMFGVMATSLGIALDRITRSRLAGEPPDIHLKPRLGHIGLLEFDRADEAIAEGKAVVERALPELREALRVFGIGTRMAH